MKKILLLLFGCFALFTAQAQNRDVFTCKDTTTCVSNIDILLQDAKRTYNKVDSYMYDNKFIVEYKAVEPNSDATVKLRVVFLKRAKGANLALEQPGQTVYELQYIIGKYLDIFPVWKKYIDPSADIEALSTKGYSDSKKFENTDGSGEEYSFQYDSQNKALWNFSRVSWYTTSKI